MDDGALLDAWRSGDRAAGNQLFERHFDAIYRFFSRKLQGEDEAAELVQRTFLACVEAAVGFRREASFRTFLFAIARHELYGYWRARRRAPELDVAGSSVLDLSPSPSTMLRGEEAARALIDSLLAIPLELQLVLELYYVESLTAAELGRVLDLPEGTARSRIRRAREALLARLGAEPAQPWRKLLELEDWSESLREALAPELLSAS